MMDLFAEGKLVKKSIVFDVVYFYISVIMVIDDANAFVVVVECLLFVYVSCKRERSIGFHLQ